MQYEYITSGTRAEQVAKELMSQPVFAFDTETTGLDHNKDKVTLASFTTKDKKTYLVDTRENPKIFTPFKAPLESEEVVTLGFNLNFDYRMTKGTFGISLENPLDLHLGELCLTQGLMKGGRDLEAVTERYLNKSRDKTLQTSFINHTGEFSEAQKAYAAQDTADLIDIAHAMTAKIRSYGDLRHTWAIENKSMPAWADIVYYGQKIDVPAWKAIISDNEKALHDAKLELDEHFRSVVDVDIYGALSINYGSPSQLLIALNRMGLKVDGKELEDTDKKMQKKLRDVPVIKSLMKYRMFDKAVGTYGYPYLEAIHPLTGRIHPKVNQYGTESGRPTCNKPNILNVPREARYRNAFITDEGRLILTVDYSGAELRILAELSGDMTMINGFNSGVDFHCFVASMLFMREVTKKNENKHLRTPTKELNFGIAYGMAVYSLWEKINGNGYPMTIEEVQALFDKYCATFKTALGYLRDQGEVAKKHFFIQTTTGRMRHWREPNMHAIADKLRDELGPGFNPRSSDGRWEVRKKYNTQMSAIAREGGNFPVQSMNADMTKIAMYEIRKECKRRGYDARMYNSVYDELVIDCKASDAEAVYEIQCRQMIAAAHKYLKRVPMEVEGHIAPCWTK